MLKKLFLISLIISSSFVLIPSQGLALNLMESLYLKISIVENGIEHEWEYTSPGKYEYEKGERVIKTKVAKEEMHSIIKTLNLSKSAKIEDMVKILKQERFPKLERLDIRWMDGENKLYTWVWIKNE
ncbi:hypothetical protein BKP45_11770 [Anaerobacillus alkalidiazotrophicus]|uniref:Uncharacterized protein n=1 Tax=Anaerobacillus alkalidiazotrophicus TaxID=472963 RepID=A0A1S2M7T9_9BACI|nr:hypothetical protein [Anaerobacillus alkalidiazotrophicus]OIJ18256.1 hypothetical protein BKP45_17485 [Anaerobacillus alkalidiazotrophicus]OIJ19735.1 hypothetical protein BKP45_11770 [Anaerobacillus alkalidiazotrophicus]